MTGLIRSKLACANGPAISIETLIRGDSGRLVSPAAGMAAGHAR
jgi:hypothetical protein